MNSYLSIVPVLFAGIAWCQPPAIFQGAVTNAASGMHPVLAGGAIARGSRFTIRGLRFGTNAAALTLKVTQGSSTVSTPILKLQTIAANSQVIEARMPTDAPLGTSQLIVMRGAEASRPFSLKIAAASFGIDSSGVSDWAPGRIFVQEGGKRRAVSYAQPARYGESLVLTGTGLGDETRPEVMVGGVSANVSRAVSRSGLDEIEFSVPKQAPYGCTVPLYVRVHKQLVSNFVSLALSNQPGPCRDSHGWPGPLTTPGQRGGVVLVSKTHSEIHLKNQKRDDTTTDDASTVFLRSGPKEKYAVPLHPLPPRGTCVAYSRPHEGRVLLSGTVTMPILTAMTGAYMNAGPDVAIEGPNGQRRLFVDPIAVGYYGGDLGGVKPGSIIERPLFLDPGSEVHVSGAGGTEVGPFSLSLKIASKFQWTNRDQTQVVDRRNGLTFEWRDLEPERIMGVIAVNVDEETGAMGLSFCISAPGASSITIPPALLSNLPASQNIPGIPWDFVALVSLPDRPTPLAARGLDAAYGMYVFVEGKTVEFR